MPQFNNFHCGFVGLDLDIIVVDRNHMLAAKKDPHHLEV